MNLQLGAGSGARLSRHHQIAVPGTKFESMQLSFSEWLELPLPQPLRHENAARSSTDHSSRRRGMICADAFAFVLARLRANNFHGAARAGRYFKLEAV